MSVGCLRSKSDRGVGVWVLLPLWPGPGCRAPWTGPWTPASHRNPRGWSITAGRWATRPAGLVGGGFNLLPLRPGPSWLRPDELPTMDAHATSGHLLHPLSYFTFRGGNLQTPYVLQPMKLSAVSEISGVKSRYVAVFHGNEQPSLFSRVW